MLLAIAPIHRAVGVARINVTTFQSVSGAGKKAMEELGRQCADRFNFREPEPDVFPVPIAFNVIPAIDRFEDNGYTREEMKMHNEDPAHSRQRLDHGQCDGGSSAGFLGHGESIHLETVDSIEISKVRTLLKKAPGVRLMAGNKLATPLVDAAGHDEVFYRPSEA